MGGEVSNTKEHKREKTAAYEGEEGAKMGLKVDEYNDHCFCLFVCKPSTFKPFLFLSITGDGNVRLQDSQCVRSEISICRSGDIFVSFYYHQVKIQNTCPKMFFIMYSVTLLNESSVF